MSFGQGYVGKNIKLRRHAGMLNLSGAKASPGSFPNAMLILVPRLINSIVDSAKRLFQFNPISVNFFCIILYGAQWAIRESIPNAGCSSVLHTVGY